MAVSRAVVSTRQPLQAKVRQTISPRMRRTLEARAVELEAELEEGKLFHAPHPPGRIWRPSSAKGGWASPPLMPSSSNIDLSGL